jgi:myo-inositol-1(or 4)-monophosphatase
MEREDQTILNQLEAMFRSVARALEAPAGRFESPAGINPKGDQVKRFDLAADEVVRVYLEEEFSWPVRLWSEEAPPRNFGSAPPEFTLVLDPVDGSDNFDRGIPICGMAAAMIPAHLPVAVDNVGFAVVGDLVTHKCSTASRGGGCIVTGDNCLSRSTHAKHIGDALISCELNHYSTPGILADVLGHARGVRSFGCCSMALTMVATGAVDAHVDLRNRLTSESFLAASLILTEAGGTITDPSGTPLGAVNSLTQRFSLIAAATPELHMELVQALGKSH